MKKNNNWKVCSRGHKYKGSGPCPVCWPGGKGKKNKIISLKSSSSRAKLTTGQVIV